jgi:putative aminopeptidase FrvX
VGLVFAVLHFLGWFTGVTADLGPYSPGANDNAAAVGVVLALAERLTAQPLEHTEVWLAFTGCEETGCDGMLAFLGKHGDILKDALFIDLELPGIGERLAYLTAEGVVRRKHIPHDMEQLVRQVGERFGLEAAPGSAAGYFTEAGAVWEHGYQAVCLVSLPRQSNLLPEWHRLTDRPERLQPEALARMGELVWGLLSRLDEQKDAQD